MVADPKIIPLRYGALPTEWASWCAEHGLTEDLLPVVSNPGAKIAAYSTIKLIGKTPSRYNRDGLIVGIEDWPKHRATEADIKRWSAQADYGVCIQTRRLRALDIDVADPVTVARILEIIGESMPVTARRGRADSAKCLLPVWVEGDLSKRRLTLPDGSVIEFLAGGQQFIASGTHPKGARYEWAGGQPESFPSLELEEFEALWLRLRDELKAEDSRSRDTKPRLEQYTEAVGSDPVAQALFDQGRVLDTGRDGQLFVTCPNEGEHSTESGPTSTAYYPAHTGGYERGHWVCLHAHCAGRPDAFFTDLLLPIQFDDLTLEVEAAQEGPPAPERFTPVPLDVFLSRVDTEAWLIKHVLPATGLVTLFGESGAGKSFAVIDLAGHVALGRRWQGHKVTQARVVYLAAEGAGGIGRRFRAWCEYHGVDPATVPLSVITARPNFLKREDVKAVARAIGKAGVVVIDTAMAVTPGADENAGKEMGAFVAFAAMLAAEVGGVVVLVHHSGKDISRGQRGWSGLKGAVDTELEVTREGDSRALRLSKVRDGPLEGARWHFKLQEVVLGYDAEEDKITSAVPLYTEPPAKKSKGPKLSDLQKLVLTAITDRIKLGGSVTTDEVVEEATPKWPKPKGRDTRDYSIRRVVMALAGKDLILLHNDIVRLP